MGRWCGPALRHAPAIWVEKGNGTAGPVSAQTSSMSQLQRWRWSSEKSIATGTRNSEFRSSRSVGGGACLAATMSASVPIGHARATFGGHTIKIDAVPRGTHLRSPMIGDATPKCPASQNAASILPEVPEPVRRKLSIPHRVLPFFSEPKIDHFVMAITSL